MKSSLLHLTSITTVAALLAACGGAGISGPRTCTTSDRCDALEHCVAGACVTDTAPEAIFEAPTGVEAFALVELDGSASRDPDAEDSVAHHLWTFAAVDAPCDPPVVASQDALARARFGCAGRFAVTLTVQDSRGVASAPAAHEVVVAEPSGAAHVSAGADLVVGHHCTGSPLLCTLAGPAAVSAQAADYVGTPTFHWSVEPPAGRTLDGTRRATLAAPDAASTDATIETDGTSISGDWIFRVEARDDAGPLGSAVQRVSVGNLPPAVQWSAPPSVPHTFTGTAFTASGSASFTISDPDGDPVTVGDLVFRHAGDGEGTFAGAVSNSRITFSIAVPYGGPEAFGQLIGGPELVRALELTVIDSNDAEVPSSQAVVVSNRPPVPASSTALVRGVPHGFDGTAYVASADLAAWTDPDDDPLFADGDGADADCATYTVLANGTTQVTCRKVFDGTPGLVGFIGAHELAYRARDPWAPSANGLTATVEITNRAPVVSDLTSRRTLTCGSSTELCCHYVGDRCVSWATSLPGGSFTFSPQVTDPDGDPVQLSLPDAFTPERPVCNGTCPGMVVSAGAAAGCGITASTSSWTFSATDGNAYDGATFTLTRSCQ
ncbi:MAG: hypothetical protein QM767_22125 [Anaeromyxobacter sp.]